MIEMIHITDEDLTDFGKIGHLLAQQDVFIDDLILSFNMVNGGEDIVSYVAISHIGAGFAASDEVVIAQSAKWGDFMYELAETYRKLENRDIDSSDVYAKYGGSSNK